MADYSHGRTLPSLTALLRSEDAALRDFIVVHRARRCSLLFLGGSGRSAWAAATASARAARDEEARQKPAEETSVSMSTSPREPNRKPVARLIATERPRASSASGPIINPAPLPPPPKIPAHIITPLRGSLPATPPGVVAPVKQPIENGPAGSSTPSPPAAANASLTLSRDSAGMPLSHSSTELRPRGWTRVAPAGSATRKPLLIAAESTKKEAEPQRPPPHPLSETFLKLAAVGATEKIMSMLKSGAAEYDRCVDKDGNTVAHVAARYGKLQVLQALVLSYDIGKPSYIGNTALHYAAAKGHLLIAEWLVSEEIVSPTAASSTGATALHVAAENGQEQIIQFLLASGVPLDITSKLGSTPLHMAAEKGQLNCVRQLRLLGADHLLRNSDGMTPMHRAARSGHTEFLLKQPGSNVSDPNSLGNTALHLAAAGGHLALVQLLVKEFKAPVNAISQDLWTPFHYAASAGHTAVVQFLLANGANANARTSYNSTALHWASEGGYLPVVRLLMTEGQCNLDLFDYFNLPSASFPNCSLQDLDKDNSSAIHLAAEKGYHKLVLVFVKEFGGKLDDRAKQAMLTVTEQPLPSDVPPPSSSAPQGASPRPIAAKSP